MLPALGPGASASYFLPPDLLSVGSEMTYPRPGPVDGGSGEPFGDVTSLPGERPRGPTSRY